MKIRTQSLAFKFSAFSVLAVVGPALVIAASLILTGRRALTDSIYAQQSQTAQRLANRISIQVDNVNSVLSIASKEPGLSAFSRSRQEESLRRLLRWQPTFQEAIVIDASGKETAKLTAKGKRFVPGDLVSRKSRPEFLEALSQGKAVVSEPFFAGDRKPYLFVSCPTYGRRGVLAARMSLENLWQMLHDVERDQGATAYVVDRKGDLLAHPDPERVLMHTNMAGLSIIQKFMNGISGRESFGLHKSDSGQEMVAVLEAVPALGWGVAVEIPASRAYAPIRTMQKEVLRWTAISVFVILGLALWRVRQIVRPVAQLEAAARKISQGQLDLNFDIRTGDELERLAGSFKQMAESLKQLEELRRDLINMIIHDLKSPLSAIMGGIDYLYENESDKVSETSKRVLGLARKSSDDLLQMIQNMLDVAKMEEGKLSLRADNAGLTAILDEAIEPFRFQIDRESKSLVKNYDSSLPALPLDAQLMRRVLANLISNAVRHTVSKGTITVTARRAGGRVEIVVRDDGEGISPEYQQKIFDKFVQAERKRVHLRSGTGLGLTFCKMAVELHGGQIRVESQLGKGSSFILSLPLPALGKAVAQKNVAEPALELL